MHDATLGFSDTSQSVVLRSVAEQLKTPLMVIARQVELQQLTQNTAEMSSMGAQARTALILIDSYLLGLDLLTQGIEMQLEPISLSALTYDVAHELSPLANQYNTDIVLDVAGKYGQVMAHTSALRAALHGIGSVMTEMVSVEPGRQSIKLAVHKQKNGLVVGVYTNSGSNIQDSLRQVRQSRVEFARQSVAQVTGNSGAGLLVADALMEAMQIPLRAGRYKKQQGLAVTLLPSQQLQFI